MLPRTHDPLRLLQHTGANVPVADARHFKIDIGAAVATEETKHRLRRFVEIDGAADLEFRAGGQGGVGVAEEAGLVAAGGAVAEGQGQGQVAVVGFEGAGHLTAGAGEVDGVDVFGWGGHGGGGCLCGGLMGVWAFYMNRDRVAMSDILG